MPLFSPDFVSIDGYPEIEPSLKLDFANARALDPRITFTRASTATYVGRDGLIKTAGEDEARFDHDPATGESLGLLIEASSNNQYRNSDGGPVASTGNTTLTSNTTLTADPAGGNSASRIDRNLGGYAYQSINNTIGNSTIKTLSFWIKDNGSVNEAQVGTDGAGGRIYVNVDFSTSPPTLDWNSGNNNAIERSLDIKEYPNGWYRVAMTFAGTQTPGYQEFQFMGVPDADYFIYGVQLEPGTFATSYIPTAGATVTRPADNASITGESFSNFYNSTEGTFFAEADTINPRYNDAITDYDGGNNNYSIMGTGDSPNRFQLRFDDQDPFQSLTFGPNSTTALALNVNLTPTLDVKIAGTIKQDDARTYAKGVSILTDTSIDLINPVALYIGTLSGSSEYLNGHIKKLSYYPKALPNAQLQTLTQ